MEESCARQKKLTKLRLPQEMEPVCHRRMQYSDTDINGHVNNCRYADFVCDAMEMQNLEEDKFLSQLQIGYLAECRPGDELEMQWGKREICTLSRVWTRRANPALRPR